MTRSTRTDSGLARATLVLALVGAVLLGGAGAALVASSANGPSTPVAGPQPTPVPSATVTLVGASGTRVPWSRPLTVAVTDGTLSAVTVTDPAGSLLTGTLSGTGWTSSTTLLPSTAYTVQAQVTDARGKRSTFLRTYTTTAPAAVLHARFSPGRGSVVGVGQPVIVRFDQKVKGRAARAAVLARLQVTTVPAVEGAWRWYNSYEAHYRPATYWHSGTTITATADLSHLRLGSSAVWGSDQPSTTTFRIGKDYQSVVDVAAHTMTVRLDGKVIRVIKVSTGRDKYPTKGGVHIVLTREKVHTYNSATVGIPTASPDGYYEQLPWSMRISNGGAFVHANPATVRVQGVANVSHGCVNTSVADAEWFYYHSQLGDVVDIVHAAVGPTLWDAGMADWNYSWETWKQGNLDG